MQVPLGFLSTWLVTLGDFSLFVFETLLTGRGFLKRRKSIFLYQCELIGVNSLGVTFAAACFMGAVLGYQLYFSLHRFGAEGLIGGTVGMSLFRELAPVMSAIMVSGRAGAAMAAEIASMKVTAQVDALEVMAIDAIEYLVTPRVLAGLIVMPILAFIFALVASSSAFLITTQVMGLQKAMFWNHYVTIVDHIDLMHCFVKAAVFGLVLTWVGCFCGYKTYGGAKSVGTAARNTVVVSTLCILFLDYFLTSLLPMGIRTLKVM